MNSGELQATLSCELRFEFSANHRVLPSLVAKKKKNNSSDSVQISLETTTLISLTCIMFCKAVSSRFEVVKILLVVVVNDL